MVLVAANWCYILFTSFGIGYAFARIIRKLLSYEINSISGVLSAGIVAVTVYAQIFSVFYKVGMTANVIMLTACIITFVIWRKDIWKIFHSNIVRCPKLEKVFIPILVIIWAYCTSRGYMHYDSDLYHAQSIRWLEEYGVVKGLGNIHVRFAYNSSFFALSALYSMKFLLGQSLHAVNGFFALMLSIEVLKVTDVIKMKSIRLSDFARVGAFYYLTVIYSDITSPASDYAAMCVVFYIIIKWLSQTENDSEKAVPFALICVGGVFAVSLKLTAGFILLLVLKPAHMLIKNKCWKDIAVYMAMGLIVIIPWLLRNVIISGYLLYPFPELDIFSFDWKIPCDAAALDAAEIKTRARGLYNAELVDMPIGGWFPHWFQTELPTVGKMLVAADILCIAVFAVLLISKARKVFLSFDAILAIAAVAVSYVFWQLSTPMLRYGYAYVLLAALLISGVIICWLDACLRRKNRRIAYKVFMLFTLILTLVKSVTFLRYSYSVCQKTYYIKQQDYGIYALESFEAGGAIFYYPQNGDRVGYERFPAIPRKINIEFLGNDISEGFGSASAH